MRRIGYLGALSGLVAVSVLVAGPAAAQNVDRTPNLPLAENFEEVGHDPLNHRGMNAALAVHRNETGTFAYVGSRTDGKAADQNVSGAGVLVVDVTEPSEPEVVHEIGPPGQGSDGESSREMRVWPQQELLIVLNLRSNCSAAIHVCSPTQLLGNDNVRFYDISGEKAAAPELVAEYVPSRNPHEFFLWVDPARPDERALMFWSAPTSSTTDPSLVVTDISGARDGEFEEVAEWVATFPARPVPQPSGTLAQEDEQEDRRLHSIGVSTDGTRTYLAFLGAGFLVLDSSEVVAGMPEPTLELVTPPENRVSWTNPGAHSAVKLFGQDVALVTDEVYGKALEPVLPGRWGCPWGWVRLIDISDESQPAVLSEYKVEENEFENCDDPVIGNPANIATTSNSAHNPTVTPNVAFVTWHSAGLEAFSLTDPTNPRRTGKFEPLPLPAVVTEDPLLTTGLDKVAMWSFPVIQDGLVHVVDIRNGLYILEYTGEHANEVAEIEFLEGNSNLGDALRFEPVDDDEAKGGKGRKKGKGKGRGPSGGASASVPALAGLVQ